MDRYIGIDVHATSCTVAVVGPSGRRLGSQVVETNGGALIQVLRATPKPRHLCFEEGTQSAWLFEILSPHVDELVVIQQKSRGEGQKNDERDAFALAESLRLGTYECSVFKAPRRFTRLRALAHTYEMMRGDVVRTKNRLKSIYRSRGITTVGKRVYGPDRGEWLKLLPPPSRTAAELLYRQLDGVAELKAEAAEELVAESHLHPISGILETTPGLGAIRVAQLLPAVVTPQRFRTARQFWSYCGLGIVMRSSSDWTRPKGTWVYAPVTKTRDLNRRSNRRLKEIFKSAAVTVIKKPDHPLRQHYDRLLEAGTKPPNAKLTIARKIAAISLAIWKNQEAYDPNRHRAET